MSGKNPKESKLKKFFRTVLTPLTFITGINILISLSLQLLITGSSKINYGGVAVASIALMSLYMGWKKFYLKRKPNLGLTFDHQPNEDGSVEYQLIIHNKGDSTVQLNRMVYAFAKDAEEDGFVRISNLTFHQFKDRFLEPGDSINISLGVLFMVNIEAIWVSDVEGNSYEYQDEIIGNTSVFNRNYYDQFDSEIQAGLLEVFEKLRERNTSMNVKRDYESFRNPDEDPFEDIKEEIGLKEE